MIERIWSGKSWIIILYPIAFHSIWLYGDQFLVKAFCHQRVVNLWAKVPVPVSFVIVGNLMGGNDIAYSFCDMNWN